MYSGDRAGRGSSVDSRGQTTIDFTIGISLFLAIVIFIFLFIPGLLDPFTSGTQEETVAADRVADQVTKGMLAHPTEPYVLDRKCTVGFFAGSGPGAACDYLAGSSASERLGLADRQNVHVAIRGDVSTGDDGTEQLCWDGDDRKLVEEDDCSPASATDTVLESGGNDPAEQESTVTARRVVSLELHEVIVVVRMW